MIGFLVKIGLSENETLKEAGHKRWQQIQSASILAKVLQVGFQASSRFEADWYRFLRRRHRHSAHAKSTECRERRAAADREQEEI